MNILSIILALAALVGLAVVWFRLANMKAQVDALGRLHPDDEQLPGRAELVALPSLFSTTPAANELEVPLSATEKLIVLGYRYESIIMDNQSNGESLAVKTVRIEIPPGTTHVVPSIKGLGIAFGKLIPGPDNEYGWDPEDHHFGLESVNIHVREIGQVTAKLEVTMLLRDYNGDDRWGGGLVATLLFLGPHPGPTP